MTRGKTGAVTAAVVIADASPLVALSLIDQLKWLPQLFGAAHVVDAVLAEVLTGHFDASERAIELAVNSKWLVPVSPDAGNLSTDRSTDLTTGRVTDFPDHAPGCELLDLGEAQTIAYALQQTHKPLVLMDERAGRKVCAELHLPVLGTGGLIVLAKRRGLLARIKPEFERLHQAGFWIAPVVTKTLLEQAGEWP
jgi:predicted nucleic acid-binding protein